MYQVKNISYLITHCEVINTVCIICYVVFGSSLKPSKKLVDVYRHVFNLRREVFTHRPILDNDGTIPPGEEERFRLQCNGICVTLVFLTCILEPALPEETGKN